NIEAVKTLGQVGHASQHAVTLVRPRNGKPHAAHVIPREVVEGQILVDGLDPPSYGGLRTVLGPRRSLQQLRRDGRPVRVDGADLGGRRAAVGTEVNPLFPARSITHRMIRRSLTR